MICYGKCNKIGNYAYFPAVMYHFYSNREIWWKTKVLSNFPVILQKIYVKWRIWMPDRLFITIARKYVWWLLSLRECTRSPNSVSKCSNKWIKEIQIIVYIWTKILCKRINKSNFSLHQLVIERNEKQNKRNVKHDDVNKCLLFLHDKLLWHLELHSLFDFLHEQRLLRHDVLQLHLLYPWPPNSDAFPAHSLNEILTDGTSAILTVPSVLALNWFLAYHKFSIPSFIPILYKSLVRSASIITPKIFLESHLPRSTSDTRIFTVSQTFPYGNFSLADLMFLFLVETSL